MSMSSIRSTALGRIFLGLVVFYFPTQSMAIAGFQPLLQPAIGLDYLYQHQRGNEDWKRVFPHNYHDVQLYLANRFHYNFGIELGYYHHLKASRHEETLGLFWGQSAGGDTAISVDMRNKGFILDLQAYLDLDPQFKLMGFAGLETRKTVFAFRSESGTTLATALAEIRPKNRLLYRLGVGVVYEERHYGIRGRVSWNSAYRMKFNLDSLQTNYALTDPKLFTNGVELSIGIFYKL